MARGKHRTSTPVRLVAAVAAALAVGGLLVQVSTASANDGQQSRANGVAQAEPGGDNGGGDSGNGGGDGGDAAAGGGDNGGGDNADAGTGGGDNADAGADGGDNADAGADGDAANGDADGDAANGDAANGGDAAQQGDAAEQDGAAQQDGAAKKDDAAQQDDAAAAEEVEFPGREKAAPPAADDFVDIQQVSPNVDEPQPGQGGSAGTFTSVCGTNAEGHRNSDNFMVTPGKVNGAQHVHEYVGNLSTDAFSTNESLDAAGTTCAKGDKSTYFWPTLRNTAAQGNDVNADGGGLDGNFGQIIQAKTADMQFRGNPASKVTAMPENLAVITGDAKAVTNGDANAKAAWSCTGFEDRTTTKYPLCPAGSDVVRILDFPSCWDGENLDSEDHRQQVVFPDDNGQCDSDRVAVPQLRMRLTFDRPDGRNFALDSFPDQQHNPITDHGDFMNMMPEATMNEAVDCINTGKTC